MRTTALDTIAATIKHAITGGVIVTLAWLALCAAIVAQTGSTDGISDVGLVTVCLAHEVIVEPTATLAGMLNASTDASAANRLVSACWAESA